MSQPLHFFATTPKGLELILKEELRLLGIAHVAEKLAGVEFSTDLSHAYKACLWSRFANRILLQLNRFPAEDPQKLYAGIQCIQWDEHLTVENTLSVNFVSSQSAINHTLFGAQKVKDAIVDQLRDKFGSRPNVSRGRPDLSVYVYLRNDIASVYIDLSGESLHKRGYRLEAGKAPLKENLAAAILQRANWPAIAKTGGALLDPLCGSGTLLIEAALMAGDIAPGLARSYFGFSGWKQHQPLVWEKLIAEATIRRKEGLKHIPKIIGYDSDPEAIRIAFANIERAGLHGYIHVEKRELTLLTLPANTNPGLVITNPPYGERLGEVQELQSLYTLLGEHLGQLFLNWQGALFTGNPDLGKQMGLRAKKIYAFFNGAIPCKLLLFNIQPEYIVNRNPEAENERRIRAARKEVADTDKQAIQMFVNRMQKNMRHFGRIAARQQQTVYRVYDADIPEYAFAIDMTEDAAHVYEYPAPYSVNAKRIFHHRQEVLAVLPDLLSLPAMKIYFHESSGDKRKA